MFAATFAKLNVALTFGAGIREDVRGDEATGTVDGGGVRGWTEGRSDPVRELVLDMDSRSRSLSTRSAISLSRADTSTGLAAPKGFERDEAGGVGPILGEESGLGEADTLSERGRRSSLRRLV